MKAVVPALALLLAASTGWAAEHDRDSRVIARLDPSNEVPAVSSPAQGLLRARIDQAAEIMEYELTFDGLQANVVMAHIHFAQPNVNGAIMVWLCGTAGAPGPTGTQMCPQSGTISGTLDPTNIQTIAPQGISTGEFQEFVRAIRNGLAYVNVHTVQSPGGEIRGQLRTRH